MISSLSVENFQSWGKVELELSPVVVIVGETDSGKSALLRALSAVLFNAIEGAGCVRKGTSRASITATANGHQITWERGASVNRYVLDGKTLDKIGRDVPAAVQQALGMEEVQFEEGGSLTLQFQPQMDAPFLLTDQGVKATRLLGSVSKVASLYKAARTSSQRSKEAKSLVAIHEQAVSQCQQRLAGYSELEGLAPDVARLRELLDLKQQSALQLVEVRRLQNIHTSSELRWERTTDFQSALRDKILVLNRKVLVLQRISNVRDAQQSLQESNMKNRVLRTSEVQVALKLTLLADRVANAERAVAIKQEQDRLEHYRVVRSRLEDLAMAAAEALAKTQELRCRVRDLEVELTCPTCGRGQD